jgi:uncharacterized protein YbjT (DUF2867 family)
MKIILLGATGMVGQGVLHECLLDPDVESVVAVVRSPMGKTDAKLREIVRSDLFDLSYVSELAGYDACFFCLGVSAAGMSEADYTRVTFDLTLAVAQALVKLNPAMCFIYVSGSGTDSTAKGRSMWARVKGRTENALLELPFRTKAMFRPALIRPMHGVRSKTRLYRIVYALLWPLYPLLRAVAPRYITTSVQVGRAMLEVAKHGAPKPILENDDINRTPPRSLAKT